MPPPQESIRGCDVFIIQPTCPPVHDNLMELMQVADACLRASARTITAVVPYFGAPAQTALLPKPGRKHERTSTIPPAAAHGLIATRASLRAQGGARAHAGRVAGR